MLSCDAMHKRLEKSSSNGSEEGKAADSLLASGADNSGLAVVARARSLALGTGVGRATGRRSGLGARVGAARRRSRLGARVGGTSRGRSGLGAGLFTVVTGARRSRLGTGFLTVVTSARRSRLRAGFLTVITSAGRNRLGSRLIAVVAGARRGRLGARLLTVVTVARRSWLGTVLGLGAARRRADRELRNLGVVGSTVAVLPRLVDDLAVLAGVAVSRSVADVVVVPVITLLRLVDGKTVAVTVGAVLGDVLRTALARASLGDVDVLAVAVLARVRLEDVDDASALAGVGVALSVVALVDGGDGLGLGGGGALDGGGEGGGDGGLVGHGSSEDVGESNISAAERDVNGEEDGVGDGLAAAETAAASKRSITTTELGVVTRALNVAEVRVDALGVVVVDLVTSVAVVVVNTKVAAALAEFGTTVEVHGGRRLNKLKGRETAGGTDTAEESKVANGAREASSRGGSGGRSGLSASSRDGLALRVGGGALRVGVDVGGSLGTSGNDGLAFRVGGSTLSVGVGLSVSTGRDDGVGDGGSRLTFAVGQSSLGHDGVTTAVSTITLTSADLDIGNSGLSGVVTTRLNKLNVGRAVTTKSSPAGFANKAAVGRETLGEDVDAVDSDIEGAVCIGTLAGVLKELHKDFEQDGK